MPLYDKYPPIPDAPVKLRSYGKQRYKPVGGPAPVVYWNHDSNLRNAPKEAKCNARKAQYTYIKVAEIARRCRAAFDSARGMDAKARALRNWQAASDLEGDAYSQLDTAREAARSLGCQLDADDTYFSDSEDGNESRKGVQLKRGERLMFRPSPPR